MRTICVCFFDMVLKQHISNKPQWADRAGFPGVPADRGIREQRCVSINAANIRGGRNDRVTVLDVFSWLPAKEISIEELEQIFIGHLNGTYKGEYKVLLEVPDNADKNILNSRAALIGEGKDAACILKGGNVIAVVGYKE